MMVFLISMALAADVTFVVVGDTQTDGEEDSVN